MMSVNTQFSRQSCPAEYLHGSHNQLKGVTPFPSSKAVVSSLVELPSYLKRLPSSSIPQPPLSRSTSACLAVARQSTRQDGSKVHPTSNPMTATFSPQRCQSPKKSESLTFAKGVSRIPFLSRSKDVRVTQSLEERRTILDLPRSSCNAVSVPTSPQRTSYSRKVSLTSSECMKPRKLSGPSHVASLPPHCLVESKRSPSKIPRASPSISRLPRLRLCPGEFETRKAGPSKLRENLLSPGSSQNRRTSSVSPSPASKLRNMATFNIRREDAALSRSGLSPPATSLPPTPSGWTSDLDMPLCPPCGNTVSSENAVTSSSLTSKRLLGTFTKSRGNDSGDESGMLEEASLQPQMTTGGGTSSRTPGKGVPPHIRTAIETPFSPSETDAVHPMVSECSPVAQQSMVPPVISYSSLQEEPRTQGRISSDETALSSSNTAPSSFMLAVTFPRSAPTSPVTAGSSLIRGPPSPGGAPLSSPPSSPSSFRTAPSSTVTPSYSPGATSHRTPSPILTGTGVAEEITREGQPFVPIPPTREARFAPTPPASNAPPRREGPVFGRNLRFPLGSSSAEDAPTVMNPPENMSLLCHQLRTDNWNVRLMGLKGVQTLAWHNPHFLQSKLEEVCKVLADEVNNLCPLACEAIDTIASLCLHLSKAMDRSAGRICLDVLLKLSQTTNKFILQKDVSFQELLVDPNGPDGFTEPVSELISSDLRVPPTEQPRPAEAVPVLDPESALVPASLDDDSEYSAHPEPHLPDDPQRDSQAISPASRRTAGSDNVLTKTSSCDQDVSNNLYIFFRRIRSDQWRQQVKGLRTLQAAAHLGSDLLQSRLLAVFRTLEEEVNSQHCIVVCEAINTLAALHLHLAKVMTHEEVQTCLSLLLKYAQMTNKFIYQREHFVFDILLDPSFEEKLREGSQLAVAACKEAEASPDLCPGDSAEAVPNRSKGRSTFTIKEASVSPELTLSARGLILI